MIRSTLPNPMLQAETVYLDIETFGPTGEISAVRELKPAFIKPPVYTGGLSLGLGSISVVTVLIDDQEDPIVFEYRRMGDDDRRGLLGWLFQSHHKLVAHNAGFDLSFLLREALRLRLPFADRPKVIDTLHMAKIAQVMEHRVRGTADDAPKSLSLRDCCMRYLGLDIDKTQQKADWSGILTDEMVEYAQIDVLVLRALVASPLATLCEPHLGVINDEGGFAFEVAVVAARGMFVGLDDLIGLTEELSHRLETQRAELIASTGLNEITALGFGRFLADRGIDLLEDENGKPMCNSLSLNLAIDDHPAVRMYLSYLDTKQELDKVLSLWTGYDPDVQRVYSLWSSWSAPSGRLGCSKPNLMSLPKTTRRIFTASDMVGHLSIADLSQIQVRAVAVESRCPKLRQQFLDGGDVHRQLASQVYEKPPMAITTAERSAVKPGTFGFLFGGGVETFVKSQIEGGNLIDWDVAVKIKTAFSKAFPGVVAWQRRGFEQMRTTQRGGRIGYTVGGLPYRVKTGTANLNYPIQAYDALILKLFVEEAHRRGWAVVGLLHDEVVVEGVPIGAVVSLLEEVGTIVLDFPVKAEGSERSTWAA